MREPWGHTPSTHIGGTWGEEDDEDDFDDGVILAPDLYPTWPSKSNSSVWGANSEGKSWGNQNSSINQQSWGGESCKYNFF